MCAASRAVVAAHLPATAGNRFVPARFSSEVLGRANVSRPSRVATFEAVCATEDDHPAIHQLLKVVGQDPTSVEFHSQIEAPRYDPMDRFIVKHGDDVIAHVHLQRRKLIFGGCEVPATRVQHLAVLPEYEAFDLKSAVMAAAFDEMRRDGTMVVTAMTDQVAFFEGLGWVPWRRFTSSVVSARDLLAHLEPKRAPSRSLLEQPRKLPRVRIWRHCELEAMARIHSAVDPTAVFGRSNRLGCDWQWLMCRRGYDRVYVADMGDGPDFTENNIHSGDDIVGYAVMKQDRIVELITEPGNVDAARTLLARVCYDAIENGRRSVEISAPADDPLHELFVAAGGTHSSSESSGRQKMLAKPLDPVHFLNHIRPLLKQRARDANLPLGTRVSFSCGSIRFSLSVNKRSVSVSEELDPELAVFLPEHLMLQMLLGHIDIREQHEANKVHATTDEALRMARVLLPPVAAWSSPLDDLPARTW